MTTAARPSFPSAHDLLEAQGRGHWGKALAIVLALHVAAVAIAVLWQGTQLIEPKKEEMSISLDLAPMPVADEPPAAAPRVAASQPVQRQQPVAVEQPRQVLQPETPLPVVAPQVPVAVRAPVAAVPIGEAGAPTAGIAGSGTSADAGGSIAATAPGGSGRGGRGGGDAAAAWRGRVLAHLDRHKRYPPAARMMKREGRAQVNLTMDRGGRVLTVSLGRGAGFKAFDEEAVDVVKRAQPLPAPPPEVEGENIPMQVPIGFSLRGTQ